MAMPRCAARWRTQRRKPGPATSTCVTTRTGCIASSGYHAAGCHAWAGGHTAFAKSRDHGGRAGAGRGVTARRLASGGLIDRTRPVRFSFDGKSYGGFTGDTLASALLASGVRLFGRSFKYHRPRGVLSAGSEEPNALVEIGTGAKREPNTRGHRCRGL